MSYDSAQRNELRAMLRLRGGCFSVFATENCLTVPEFEIQGVLTTRTKRSKKHVVWVEPEQQALEVGMVLKAAESTEYWAVTSVEEDMGRKKLIKMVYSVVKLNPEQASFNN